MTEAEARALYRQGEEAVVAVLVDFGRRLQELEARLGTNSTNSSKPPSSDNKLTKAPKVKNDKRKASRGGQKGHLGKTLMQRDNPDRIEVLRPMICSGCGHDLQHQESRRVIKRQVFDLPLPTIEVTEYQSHSVVCGCCRHTNTPAFPKGINAPTQYGTNLQSFIGYLSTYQMIPYERISELIEDLCGHNIATGSIITMLHRAHKGCEATQERIKTLLGQSDMLHCDETGVSIEGKLHWMHVASTSMLTTYHLSAKRGKDAMDAMGILPAYQGIAMHDHWSAYNHYECDHAFCNAHHLRELQSVIDNEKLIWASDMKQLLIRMKQMVYQSRENGEMKLTKDTYQRLWDHYDTITAAASSLYERTAPPPSNRHGRHKQPKGKNLLDRLIQYKTETLRFMQDFRVPFTNNQAERDLRMIKVKEKISGTIASQRGGHYFARIRGYISTVKKQGGNVLQELRNALEGRPFLPGEVGG